MINATPESGERPMVINGGCDLFAEVFGKRARHARCAVDLGSLPRQITVAIECVVEATD